VSDKTWECSYERVKPDEVSVCPTCKHYNKCNDKCAKGHHPIRTSDGWIVEDCDDYEARECPDCIYYVRNKPKCATGRGVLTPYHTWRAERCGDYTPKVAEAPEADEAKQCPDCVHYVKNESMCKKGLQTMTAEKIGGRWDVFWYAVICACYTPKTAEAPEAYDADEDGILEIIRAKLTPEQYQGYLYGNTIRHARRRNYAKVMHFLYLLWEAHHD